MEGLHRKEEWGKATISKRKERIIWDLDVLGSGEGARVGRGFFCFVCFFNLFSHADYISPLWGGGWMERPL